MKRFKNIIYVTHGIQDDTHGFNQAFKLAHDNEAKLKILIVYPKFPKNLVEHKTKFEEMLLDQLKAKAEHVRSSFKVDDFPISFSTDIEGSDNPGTCIIKRVLRESHDLIIKEVESKETKMGFKALDMELLRKCPCPVWLWRKTKHKQEDYRVAVAIDPESIENTGRELSIKLLQLSRSLADANDKKLTVISCWDFIFEDYFRHGSRVRMEEEELIQTSQQIEREHNSELQLLIYESGIKGNLQIYHVRGAPDKIIPKYVEDNKIDILIMGTLARKGILGFIIGNTAENIIQLLGCTLLAVKPDGFVSPVKAY